MISKSIHKQTISNIALGKKISPFQQRILDSFKLDESIFSITLTDEVANEVYNFARWDSTNESDNTVYDYMNRRKITIEQLEREYLKSSKANQTYDDRLEQNHI